MTTLYSDVQNFFKDFIQGLDDAADIARPLCEDFTEMNIIRHQISVIHLAADGFTKFQRELEEFPLDGTEDDRFKHQLLLTFYRENHEKLGRLVDDLVNHFQSFFETVSASHSAYPRLLALGNIIIDLDDDYANLKMV